MTDCHNLESKKYLLPDIGDILFYLVLYLVIYLKSNMLFTDGSTAWHLVTGNYILQNHQVPHTDIMSYTFINKPWVAYEWLSDVLMASLVKLGGLNLLMVVSASAIALLILLIYRRCRDNGCNFILAGVLTIIGSLVSAIHWLARPHLFTFFGVFIFATLLDLYYRGTIEKKKLALFLTLYMLIWVNSHPGFMLGFALIGIYLASMIFEYVFLKAQTTELNISRKDKIQGLTLVLILNMVATLFNPYSYHIYSYISHYLLKSGSILAATDEFLSPIFHGALQPSLLEVLFAFTLVGLLISKTRLSLPDLLVYLLFAHLSLSAQRHMALYVIVAVPIIGRLYASTELDAKTGAIYKMLQPFWQSILDKFANLNGRITEMERRCSYHILSKLAFLALIAIALNGGMVFGHDILKADFDENSKPHDTLIAIKRLNLDPKHGFSMDNWGGIIKYKLGYPVFIDDRTDFYGENFFLEYANLIQTMPGWQNILKKYQIQWILLPKDSRLIAELKLDSHWQIISEDKSSTLIVLRESMQSKR